MEFLRLFRPAPTACPWKGAAACAAIYFAATPLSGWITAAGLPVWLATGAALTTLVLLGLSYWPAVLAAGWLSAIAMGYPPLMAAPFAATGLLEALTGMAILRHSLYPPPKTRAFDTMISVVLVSLVVPAIGATRLALLNGTAGLDGIAWKFWWIKDAAGLLLLAPVWTLLPREIANTHPVKQSAAENLLNLHRALAAFESAAPVIVTKNQETPVHRLK